MMEIKRKVKGLLARSRLFSHFCTLCIYTFSPKKEKWIKGIKKVISEFEGHNNQSKPSNLARLEKDILFSRLHYQIAYEEFFLFHFDSLSDHGRNDYVGYYELMGLYSRLNKAGEPDIFAHKDLTYNSFKNYYGRNVLLVDSHTSIEEFEKFVENKESLMVKATDQYAGNSVKKLSLSEYESFGELFDYLSTRLPCIVEEVIDQNAGMAKFHQESVNTVRVTTFYYMGVLTKLQAVIRMGRGESVVDNAGAGGIYAPIDIDTGVIKDCARSEKGEIFLFHPDTGEQIIGSRIPEWDQLIHIVEEIVKVVPEQIQVGWDFALTDSGWIMVEGNTKPVLQVFESNHGMRKLVEETFYKAIVEQDL